MNSHNLPTFNAAPFLCLLISYDHMHPDLGEVLGIATYRLAIIQIGALHYACLHIRNVPRDARPQELLLEHLVRPPGIAAQQAMK